MIKMKSDINLEYNESLLPSLAEFASQTDDFPRFRLVNYDLVHSELFRAWDSQALVPYLQNMTFLDYITNISGQLPDLSSARQYSLVNYSTPYEYAKGSQIKTDGLATMTVPEPQRRWSDCMIKETMSTYDVKDGLYLSYSRKNKTKWEPMNEDYPEYPGANYLKPGDVSGGNYQVETFLSHTPIKIQISTGKHDPYQ